MASEVYAKIIISEKQAFLLINEYIKLPVYNSASMGDIGLLFPFSGYNASIWGVTKWGDETKYLTYESYDGIITKQMSDEFGVFNPYIKATLEFSQAIDNFVIMYDELADCYCREIIINGETFKSDDIQMEIKVIEPTTTFDIKFIAVNKPNYPLMITSIFNGLEILIDRHKINIDSNAIVIGSNSAMQNRTPNTGIVSNYGQISAIDTDSTITDLAEMNLLDTSKTVNIYYGDTREDISKSKKLGTYVGKLKPIGNRYTIELKGIIERWQNRLINEIPYIGYITAYDLFNMLKEYDLFVKYTTVEKIRQGYNILNFSMFLQEIHIHHFYLNSDTLWNQWNKFLALINCVMYILPNGDLYITDELNIINKPIIRIDKNLLIAEPRYTILADNIINGVSIIDNIVSKTMLSIPNGVWNAITNNNGFFVAVGDKIPETTISSAGIMYSHDGQTFTEGTIPNGIWISITNHNNFFVAIGFSNNFGKIAYSYDGKTFTDGTITDGYWISITNYNGFFVAIGIDKTAYSYDGKTFTEGTIPNGNWNDIANYNGLFVAVGEYKIAYSYDGKTFILANSPAGNWSDITNHNGLFVVVGNNVTAYSNDGETFIEGTIPNGYWISITNHNGFFVAITYTITAYSHDGITFILGILPKNKDRWTSITNHNGFYVVIGNTINSTNSLGNSNNGRIFRNSIISTSTFYEKNPIDIVETEYIMETNELMQNDTTMLIVHAVYPYPVSILKYHSDNILKNYRFGLRTISFEIYNRNLYDINGNLIYSKKDGQFIKVGDLVQVFGFDDKIVAQKSNNESRTFIITSAEMSIDKTTKIEAKEVNI